MVWKTRHNCLPCDKELETSECIFNLFIACFFSAQAWFSMLSVLDQQTNQGNSLQVANSEEQLDRPFQERI